MADEVKVTTILGTAQVAGGTQDFTLAGFGTPVAALFVISQAHDAQHATTNHIRTSVGFTDGTNQRVWSIMSRNAQANMVCKHRVANDEVVLLMTNTGTINGEANFTSWITDGVRITWGNAPSSDFRMLCVLWGGSNVQAAVGNFSLSGQDVATDITGVGFEPHQLMVIGGTHTAGMDDTTTANNAISMGWCDNGRTIEQRSQSFFSIDTPSTSRVSFVSSRTYAAMHVGDGVVGAGCDIGGFNNDGFTATARDSTTGENDDYIYLAVNYGPYVAHSLFDIDSPNAPFASAPNTDVEYRQIGYSPIMMLGLNSYNWNTEDTLVENDDGSNLGFSGVTLTGGERGMSWSEDDNVGTQDTGSVWSNNSLVYVDQDASFIDGGRANISSWDTDGFTLTWAFSERAGAHMYTLLVGDYGSGRQIFIN
jgi:hypothetical protein